MVACQGETSLALYVVTPDGGSPFVGAGAATEARLRLEDNRTAPQRSAVAANGAFTFDLVLTSGGTADPFRAVLEARNGDTLVGWGATPALRWSLLGPTFLPIFVQRRDSVVEAPWGRVTPRLRPFVAEIENHFVVMLGGASATSRVEVLNLTQLAPANGGAAIDDAFNRDASVLRLSNGQFMLVRGCQALVWNPADNAAAMPATDALPPGARCSIVGSTAVQDPAGGGWLLGGRDAAGPSTRVDRLGGNGRWSMTEPLQVGRDAPAALRVGPSELLVAGGQGGAEAPTFERYNVSLPAGERLLRSGASGVDARTELSLVALNDGVALALGGRVAGSTDLVADDLLIDLRCLEGGCAWLAARGGYLRQRRRGASAALSEGDRVVVAGGEAAGGGVADAVEHLDVSAPRAPQGLGPVGSLPFAGLVTARLSTGAVLITGGNQNSAWFYRH